MNTLESAPRPATPTMQRIGRVLLVDDEPVLRAMASSMLMSQGWEVLSASSAEEAAQLLKYCSMQNTPVDMVIMDLIMPGGMSGVEAVTALRNIQPGARMIASSGFLLGNESRDACLGIGFDDVLPKPYGVEQLVDVALRNHRRTPGH